MKLTLAVLLCCSALSIAADPAERAQALDQARQFLSLAPDAQKAFSQKLSAREAEALRTQIITLRKAKNPDITALDYVLSQLATITAQDVAQTRLNSLLWAITLTFLLLIAFLGYVLYDQRRLAAALSAREQKGLQSPGQAAPIPPIAASKSRKR